MYLRIIKPTLILILALMLTNFIDTSFAWYTWKETSINTFTIGSVDGEIIEDFTPPENFIPAPNSSIKKVVQFKNTGKNSIYLRARIDPMWVTQDGDFRKDASADVKLDLHHVNQTGNEWKVDWIFDNGYYYYKKSLAPGDTTTILLESVHFKNDFIMQDSLMDKILRVRVVMECIQTSDFSTYNWGLDNE